MEIMKVSPAPRSGKRGKRPDWILGIYGEMGAREASAFGPIHKLRWDRC